MHRPPLRSVARCRSVKPNRLTPQRTPASEKQVQNRIRSLATTIIPA
jgi:hypothetical protein